jgi:alkyl sulfatase BDS1-like metallo-beta-lactamase superfamily hydrolase
MELSNGALIHHPTSRDEPADLTITLTHPQLLALLSGTGSDQVQFEGDQGVLGHILGLTGEPDTAMRIVSP